MELGDPDDDLWWVRKKLERERLQVLPPALEIRLDLERTLERIGGSSTAGEVRREVESLNERIKAANQAAVWGPPATTMPLDGEAVVRTWEARRTDSPS